MTYDQQLAARIREVLRSEHGVEEKPMFGGLAFMVDGHMAVAASGQGGMLVRVDPSEGAGLVEHTAATPMVMRGRPMAGWLTIDAAHVADAGELAEWVSRGVGCARSLPAK